MARDEVSGKKPVAETPFLGKRYVEEHFNCSRSGVYGLIAAAILDKPLKLGRTASDARVMGNQLAA